jgi:hypothetical protein
VWARRAGWTRVARTTSADHSPVFAEEEDALDRLPAGMMARALRERALTRTKLAPEGANIATINQRDERTGWR